MLRVLCPMLPVFLVIHSWLSPLCYVLFCLCLVPNVACVSGLSPTTLHNQSILNGVEVLDIYCIVIWKIRKMNRVRSDMDSQHDNVTIVNTEHNNWQQKVNLVFRLWHTQTCSIVLGEILYPMLLVSLVIHSWLSLLCYVLFCLCLVSNVARVSGCPFLIVPNKTKHNTEGTIKNG
jgi:hypothetical protein